MNKTLIKLSPIAVSQLLFGFSNEIFNYLIPDISLKFYIDTDDIWMRNYIDVIFVVPFCVYLVNRVKFFKIRGFGLSNLIAAAANGVLALAFVEGNHSPLLYILIYRIGWGICWVFVSTLAIEIALERDLKKVTIVFAYFQMFYGIGHAAAPFIGYLVYKYDVKIIFCCIGSIQLIYSLSYLFLTRNYKSSTTRNLQVSNLFFRPQYFSSLILQLISSASLSFLSMTLFSKTKEDYHYSESTINPFLLTFKIPFLISCLFFPAISKLHSKASSILLYGYLLFIPGYLLSSSLILQPNILITSISLILLGFASVWIHGKTYLVPPVSRLFNSIKGLYGKGMNNDLIFQSNFIICLVLYFGYWIGLIFAASVKENSWYSNSFVAWAGFFLVLSGIYVKFLNNIPSVEKIDPTLIEMIEVNWEES